MFQVQSFKVRAEGELTLAAWNRTTWGPTGWICRDLVEFGWICL